MRIRDMILNSTAHGATCSCCHPDDVFGFSSPLDVLAYFNKTVTSLHSIPTA